MNWVKPCASTRCWSTAWAIGERHILPRQTNSTATMEFVSPAFARDILLSWWMLTCRSTRSPITSKPDNWLLYHSGSRAWNISITANLTESIFCHHNLHTSKPKYYGQDLMLYSSTRTRVLNLRAFTIGWKSGTCRPLVLFLRYQSVRTREFIFSRASKYLCIFSVSTLSPRTPVTLPPLHLPRTGFISSPLCIEPQSAHLPSRSVWILSEI